MTNLVFTTFGGLRFRGRISKGILDVFCMLKPSKNIQKTMVLELFQLFEKVLKSTKNLIQNELRNHPNP